MEVYGRCCDQWRDLQISNTEIIAAMDVLGIARSARTELFDDVKTIITTIAEAVTADRQRQQEKEVNSAGDRI